MKKILAFFLTCILGTTIFVGCTNETKTSSNNKEKKQVSEEKEMNIKEIVKKEIKGTVKEDYDLLEINYDLAGITPNMDVKSALHKIKGTLSKLKDNKDFKKFKLIMFKGYGEFEDKYGKKEKKVALKNTFDVKEIEKVEDFKNITVEQLIALQGKHKTFCNGSFKKELKEKTLKLLYPN